MFGREPKAVTSGCSVNFLQKAQSLEQSTENLAIMNKCSHITGGGDYNGQAFLTNVPY